MPQRKTLAERLADISSAARSVEIDPEAPVYDDGTAAGKLDFKNDEEIPDEMDRSPHARPSSSLRTTVDMEMIGEEYQGKRVSRKDLSTTSWPRRPKSPDSIGEGAAESSSEGGEESDEVDGDEQSAAAPSMNLDDISSSSEEEDEPGDDDEQVGEQHEQEVGDESYEESEEANDDAVDGRGQKRRRNSDDMQAQSSVFEAVSSKSVDAMMEEQITQLYQQDNKAKKGRGVAGKVELERAKEVLRQRQWWDSLLEVRILLQRLLNVANRLPGHEELQLFMQGDETLRALATEGATAARGLAKQLSKSRQSHMSCWRVDGSDHDELSTGDVSEETIAGEGVNSPGTGGSDREEAIVTRDHERCMAWWEAVIGRWHERTQAIDPSLQRKFKVVNQGPWTQVTASLADRERASRKMFMPRAETDQFLGRRLAKRLKARRDDSEHPADVASARMSEGGGGDCGNAALMKEDDGKVVEVLGRERRHGEESLDPQVFDDRNLYQYLLKEFMESSAGVGDSASSGVAVRRKSLKKTVDRRASKGRKIKYVTHPKMQNFMFPQEYPPPPMEPSELFSSLLGGAVYAEENIAYTGEESKAHHE